MRPLACASSGASSNLIRSCRGTTSLPSGRLTPSPIYWGWSVKVSSTKPSGSDGSHSPRYELHSEAGPAPDSHWPQDASSKPLAPKRTPLASDCYTNC